MKLSNFNETPFILGTSLANFLNTKCTFQAHFLHVEGIFKTDIGFILNTSLAEKGALAHRLQRRTACKIQNGRQG